MLAWWLHMHCSPGEQKLVHQVFLSKLLKNPNSLLVIIHSHWPIFTWSFSPNFFQVKQRLHQRLQELEPLPELLRATELRLHEANEKLVTYERRSLEQNKMVAELTAKVCSWKSLWVGWGTLGEMAIRIWSHSIWVG